MKPRPRHAENRVAEILSDFFVSRGYSPVERQPIIGRTGPDLTTNEIKLVLDVKSRLEIPLGYIAEIPLIHGDLVAIPLSALKNETFPFTAEWSKCHSVQVDRYWSHMDEWRRQKMPDGITAIVLHRPKLRFDMAQLVIHLNQINLFQERIACQTIKSL